MPVYLYLGKGISKSSEGLCAALAHLNLSLNVVRNDGAGRLAGMLRRNDFSRKMFFTTV
jgi:hypothetical protein